MPRRATVRDTGLPRAEGEAPDAASTRLSLYLRALNRCEAEGRAVVSSREMARATGTKPALVRKDLARFGQFGIRGVGYEVPSLRTQISAILGLDRDHNIVILGAGNLGMALADSRSFNTAGFRTVALFDSDARKVGTTSRGGVPVHRLRELAEVVRRNRVDVAVIAVPIEGAQAALDRIARAGVRAVLNFAPARLKAPRGVAVRSVDLRMHLEGLTHRMTHASPRGTPRAARTA